jgi:hypothetical protein
MRKDALQAGRSTKGRARAHLGLLALLLLAAAFGLPAAQKAHAAGGISSFTIHAYELNDATNQIDFSKPLDTFTYTINVDNSPSADNPDPTQGPGWAPIPSNSPVVAVGNQDSATVTLPDNEPYQKYLVSLRSPDHKLWGGYVSLPQDDGQSVSIGLRKYPLKLGKLVVHVFQDNTWTNGAPDTGEGGLAGFHITLEDQIDGPVQSDYYNNPLCTNYLHNPDGTPQVDDNGLPIIDSSNPGGSCITDANGDVTIQNLDPATYNAYATPLTGNACPNGSRWTQTTTIDGGLPLLVNVTENDDGLGLPGETLWEGPNAATGWWFGFVCSHQGFANANASGSISGTARNWVGWAPFDQLTLGENIAKPYLALSDSGTDTTVWVGQGDDQGNFTIPNVPDGSYNLAIWDEQLSYIMRFVAVTVTNGQAVDLGDVGVSRWFGFLDGYVYQDIGKDDFGNSLDGQVDVNGNTLSGTAGNGIRDCVDPNDWTTCEPGIRNFPMDQRWRDGSMKEDTVTSGDGDPHGPGYYEYPQAEGGGLGKFIINEVGFDRFGTEPGASVHSETPDPNTGLYTTTHIPTDLGGGLLTNNLLAEGHRQTEDWGKRPYLDAKDTTLVGAIDATTTSITIASAAGLPTTDPWQLTIDNEKMLVTGGSGTTTLTVQRHYGYSSAAAHAAGATVKYAGEPGQIVGITYFATTRNEFGGNGLGSQVEAHYFANEAYEAAIPGVEVRLEGLGPDGLPNTSDDTILNDYVTDHWQHPSTSTDGQSCAVTGAFGQDLSTLLNPGLGPNCLETPLTGQQVKDGAFDGGYAFADDCTYGYDLNATDADHPCWSDETHSDHTSTVPLVPGTYITHMIVPKSQDPTDTKPCNTATNTYVTDTNPIPGVAQPQTGCVFRVEAEEDVNVDLGAQFSPTIPPPACTGDMHTIDATGVGGGTPLTARSPFSPDNPDYVPDASHTQQQLCDKLYIDIKPKQNANGDFFLMTNQPNGIDVEEAGRIIGGVFDDIYFDRDPKSIWYGEPRPLAHIPVGIYDYNFRLLETVYTDENGSYQAVVPSTETFNCPIPQGPCPAMYVAIVDDPGHVVPVSGTVSTSVGSATVTGTGTSFLTQVHAGDHITVRVGANGQAEAKIVKSVDSDQSLTVESAFTAARSGATLTVDGNQGYNPDYLTANTAFEVWPDKSTQLDTPIDPISGDGCELASGTPELLQVNRTAGPATASGAAAAAGYQTADGPFVRAAGTNDVWTISHGATAPTAGTFTVTINGQTTAALPVGETAAQLQPVLEGLSSVGTGNVAVSGGPLTGSTAFTLTFQGALQGTPMTVSATSSLTAPVALTAARSGTTNNVTITRGSTAPTAGSFTITVRGQTTGALTFNASPATVQAALVGLSNVGAGGVVVSGGPLSTATTFTLAYAGTNASANAGGTTVTSLLTAAVPLTVTHSTTGTSNGAPNGYVDSTAASRRITIQGVNFGTTAGTITLTDLQGRTGSSKTFTGLASAANLSNLQQGGIVSWADRQIVLQVPATKAVTLTAPLLPFYPGQYQVMITDNANASGGALSTVNGITLHVLGTVGTNTYNPRVRQVAAPVLNGHSLQDALDAANVGDLMFLAAGIYRENVFYTKPVKLQGLGIGGSVGLAEAGGPPADDPRFNVQGSGIDGQFFRDFNQPGANGAPGWWDAKLATISFNGYGNPADVPGTTRADISKGAAITVLAQSTGANAFSGTDTNAPRIDGIAVINGQGTFGAGGMYVNAYGSNLQVTNDMFQADKGQIGGAIGLGTPYHGSQHNNNIRLQYDRIQGSGGIARAGAVAIFNGADNYDIGNSTLCSNSSIEYGAGISHWGKSNNGSIHDNKIYYNDAVDSGGGISISEETPQPDTNGNVPAFTNPVRGSGAVDVRRNVIEGNWSGDDGGGIFLQDGLTARINIVGNEIVNNGAADMGGAIMVDDSSNVAFVNNTVAQNAVTNSCETCAPGAQHAGGMTLEANTPAFTAAYGLPKDFSDPVALFNNIFWDNEVCTLDNSVVPPALTGCTGDLADPAAVYLDFEIHGTNGPETLGNLRYNLLTNGNLLQSDGTITSLPGAVQPLVGFPTDPLTNGNELGVDPNFVAPFATVFAVGPSRLDPQAPSVTITHTDPPVGLQGDYHLATTLLLNQTSGAVDRGVRCPNTAVPPPAPTLANPTGPPCSDPTLQAPTADIDGQLRPQLRTLRPRTLWDLGADEVPTLG